MSLWWPFNKAKSNTDWSDNYFTQADYERYIEVPPASTMWTVTTTTTQRIRPFYHPAAYSKRWKR